VTPASILRTLRGILVVLCAVQAAYLGYAVLKSDTELFVNRGDGTVATLLGFNEYAVFSQGYRLYRVFRDYCRGCTVEVSGEEAFSVAQLREIGRVETRPSSARACPEAGAVERLGKPVRRFDLLTNTTPFGMFKAPDAAREGVPVTVVLLTGERAYFACRTGGRDFILPVAAGRG
jgi:hypothetical protein